MFANCIWHLACTVITQCYFVVSLSEPVKEQKMHLLEHVTQQWPYSNESSFLFSELNGKSNKTCFHLRTWFFSPFDMKSSEKKFVKHFIIRVTKVKHDHKTWKFFPPRKKSEPFILTRVTVIHPNICQYFFSPPDLIFKSNASIIQHGT